MRRKWQNRWLLKLGMCLFLTFSCSFILAQSKTTLEKNKKNIEAEIAYNQKLLKETESSKKLTLNQVIILNDNIRKREDLMKSLNTEVQTIDNKIAIRYKKVDTLQQNLQTLRNEYAEMIRVAQKTDNINTKMAFIFAAEDFNQAFLRLRYLQQLTEFRREQTEKIVATQADLQGQIGELEKQKTEKQALVQEIKEENDKLSEDRKKANEGIKELEKKEKDIKQTISNKQKEAKKLDAAIQKAIAEEIRKAEEKRKATNAPKTTNSDFALTPAEETLSSDFVANKGKLPWPVEKGVVSSGYGEQPHPVLKKVTIQNNGIDILSNKGAQALAAFNGTVSSVWSMGGYNNIVMIRHGEYITVYGKLETVSVKVGDNVTTRQAIGTLHTDTVSGSTEVHFELWKGKQIQNPSLWLSPFR